MIGGYIARRAVTGFVLALVAAPLVAGALVLGPVASAAAAPTLVIESPPDGSAISDRTPTTSGSTGADGSVTLNVYAGGSAEGSPQQAPADLGFGGSRRVRPQPVAEGTAAAQEGEIQP